MADSWPNRLEDHRRGARIVRREPSRGLDRAFIRQLWPTSFALALISLLSQTKAPSSPEKARIAVDMSEVASLCERARRSPTHQRSELTSSPSPVDCHLTFWKSSGDIGNPIPFQLVLASPPTARSSALAFSQLELHFNDDRPPIVVSHEESLASSRTATEFVQLGDVGDATQTPSGDHSAALSWADGSTKVFSGVVSSTKDLRLTVSCSHFSPCREMLILLPRRQISKVILTAVVGEWTLSFTLSPQAAAEPVWRLGDKSFPRQHASPTVCK